MVLRHWKELMERTGTNFEINPESFTLENMFAMELHKYSDVINEIVTSAVKELSIEKASYCIYYLFCVLSQSSGIIDTLTLLCVFFQGVKEVASTWESMKFNVIPYLKGIQERGFILGTVEEILLTIDNDAMNLQSMAGSRFVGPFLASIQQWEKYLSLISETIEVSKSGRVTDNQTD